MNNLLCSHEKDYCSGRRAKFFRTGFGEVVVTQPHFTFRKFFDIEEHGVYAFRNRGIEDDEVFGEIINKSTIPPVVSDIEDDDWRGEFGVYWR
jgi:hypothetical protein